MINAWQVVLIVIVAIALDQYWQRDMRQLRRRYREWLDTPLGEEDLPDFDKS